MGFLKNLAIIGKDVAIGIGASVEEASLTAQIQSIERDKESKATQRMLQNKIDLLKIQLKEQY